MSSANRFDSKAKEWDEKPVRVEISTRFSQMVKEHMVLTKEVNAMEFGCGTGLVSFNLYDMLGNIAMVDDSDGMMEVLSEKMEAFNVSNMTRCLGDIFEMSLPRAGYDLIYTMMALHHVPNTEGVINCFYNLLKPGGVLCIGDLVEEDGTFHDDACEVHYGFNTVDLQTMLEHVGFSVEVNDVMHIMQKTTDDGSPREFPLFFIKAVKA